MELITSVTQSPMVDRLNDIKEHELDGIDGMFSLVDKPSLFVELGSSYGALARRACLHLPDFTRIYSVDTWQGFYGDIHLASWIQHVEPWMRKGKIQGIRSDTVSAASFFCDESIDVCLVDANHDTDAVYADCVAYWSKVKPGGYLVGHDIGSRKWRRSVKNGVNKFKKGRWAIGQLHGDPKNSECWFIQKENDGKKKEEHTDTHADPIREIYGVYGSDRFD